LTGGRFELSAALWLADAFTIGLDADGEPDWLTASERARLATIERAARRTQFVLGHWLLRRAVAHRCDMPASAVMVESEADGRPAVANPAGVCASVSHSGSLAAALVDSVTIGIDVEAMNHGRDIVAIAAAVCGCRGQSRIDAYRLWVQREAALKISSSGARDVWSCDWRGFAVAAAGLRVPPDTVYVTAGRIFPLALNWSHAANSGA